MKWEPVALMILLVGLGAWLVGGPGRQGETIRIGNLRGNLVIDKQSDDSWTYTLDLRESGTSKTYSDAQMREFLGDAAVDQINASEGNLLFKLFNITGWGSLVWIAIGFGGQIAFFGRMAVQWVVSERKRQSVVPDVFWYLSLIGGIALFSYFVWRQDFVGVLGQSSGVVIYARNIRLIYKKKRRDARKAARDAESEPSIADPAPEPLDAPGPADPRSEQGILSGSTSEKPTN